MENKKGIFIIIAIITMTILTSTIYFQAPNLSLASNSTSQDVSESYKEKLIRFHVLANSDSPEDQELKLKVRDKIIEEMDSKFEQSKSIEETKKIVNENIENMKIIAKEEINKNGKDYDVNIELGKHNFPTKTYGDITLPAGEYNAVRVLIGEAKGQNWWCVMFPPLCFIDIKNGETNLETEENMKEYLTEEEYKYISTNKDEIETTTPKLKFKIVEIFKSL